MCTRLKGKRSNRRSRSTSFSPPRVDSMRSGCVLLIVALRLRSDWCCVVVAQRAWAIKGCAAPVAHLLHGARFTPVLEQGTYRLVWPQGIMRTRWVSLKLGPLRGRRPPGRPDPDGPPDLVAHTLRPPRWVLQAERVRRGGHRPAGLHRLRHRAGAGSRHTAPPHGSGGGHQPGRRPGERPFRVEPCEDEDQLALEEDDRVDGWPSTMYD
jgi:hypothetical protein